MTFMTAIGGARVALLLTIASLAAACGVGAEDTASSDVGATSDAVVAGRETFAHPEVGLVFHGGLCTGTLIRPNVVLTAMHCTGIARDEDVATAQPSFVFEIRKSATEKARFAVDRLHTITTQADMDGSQRWRARDIALLRLTTDVPASLATPAAVASSWPRLASRVAIYGYGCTDRATDASGRRPGTGTKRMNAYSWSLGLALGFGDTEDVCQGDSGGPLLDLERNAVFGITSGYFRAGPDAYGDVPANHAAIDAMASRWWPRRP